MGAARDHDESDEEPVGAGIGSICADGGELCAVDEPGGRRTGVSRIGAAEGERAAEDSFGTATDGRELSVSEQVARVSSVVYQLPCNCRCDRSLGHTSLRSCFENVHGTECSTCAKEGFYAYQQTKLGRTPAQIRVGIARHEYEAIDLDKQ
jgi:hypothetical protein